MTDLGLYFDARSHGKSSTSDFLLAAPDREMICEHLRRLFGQRVRGRSLVKRPWNPDHGPERTLTTLLGGGALSKTSSLTAGSGSGNDMVGLMSHPKVQKILEGEELILSAQVSFQWKNPDFLFRNPDFLLSNPDFLLKNVDL